MSIEESCLDKKFLNKLSSFERCRGSLLGLLMALRKSVALTVTFPYFRAILL